MKILLKTLLFVIVFFETQGQTINTAPAITGPSSVCVGTSITLANTATGTIVWNSSNTAVATINSSTGIVTGVSGGSSNISYTVTSGAGSTSTSANYPVTVNPLPVPTLTGPASTCSLSTGNVYTAQAGMSNYVWTVSAGGTITGGQGTNSINVSWNIVGAQAVTVTYTNANGCTNSSPAVYNVTVNSKPTLVITDPLAVCAPTKVDLTAPAVTSGSTAGLTYSYWTDAQATIPLSTFAAVATSGTYYIKAVSADGCFFDIKPVTVIVNSSGPQINVEIAQTVGCAGGDITFTSIATGPGGSALDAYLQYFNGANWIDIMDSHAANNGQLAFSYTISGITYPAGTLFRIHFVGSCGEASTNAKSLVITSIVTTSDACQNVPVTFSHNESTGGIWTIEGNPSNVIVNQANRTVTFTPTTPGCYNATYSVSTSTDTQSFLVFPPAPPAPVISSGFGLFTVTPPPTIAGFNIQYSYDDGLSWNKPLPTLATYIPCYLYKVKTRYVLSSTGSACGATLAGGSSSLAGCKESLATSRTIDLSAPTLTCNVTSDQTVCYNSGITYKHSGTTWDASASDNCALNTVSATLSGPSAGTYPSLNNVTFNIGITTVVWTATDQCGFSSTYTFKVTVNQTPTPTITSSLATVCLPASDIVYTTEAGMSNYNWTISPGGMITAGGTPTSNTVTVRWTTAGAQKVTVNYTNSDNYKAITPTVYNVDVTTPPIVTTHPETQIVACEESSVDFLSFASETHDPTVRWEICPNGSTNWTPLSDGTVNGFTISGALTTHMVAYVPRNATSGYYFRAAFTNSCGTTYSTSTKLITSNGPQINVEIAQTVGCAGGDITFTSIATGPGGSALDAYLQYFNGANWIDIMDSHAANIGQLSFSYTISGITYSPGTPFRIHFVGGCGDASTKANPLVLTSIVTTSDACQNVPVTFSHNGSTGGIWTIEGNPSNVIVNQANRTVTFTPTNWGSYNATYTVSTCTDTQSFFVFQAPAITTQPVTPAATRSASGNQIMSVTATGADLTYQWNKDGINLSNGEVIGGSTTATLTLTNPLTADAGSYDCVVNGKCGMVTSNAVAVIVEDVIDYVQKTDLFAPEIYPNPSSGKFYIDLSGCGQKNIDLIITDNLGKIIRKESFQSKQSIKEYKLPRGMYFVIIKSDDKQISTNKLVVN